MTEFFQPRFVLNVGGSTLKANLIDKKRGLYALDEEFMYTIRYKGKSYLFVLPAGFITNFATVPRFAWKLFHPTDPRLLVASCVHDFVLNEFAELQPDLTRTIWVDGTSTQISDVIDGFLAADLFFFSLSQEGSYSLPVRQFLRLCVKGYYFSTLKGWGKIR